VRNPGGSLRNHTGCGHDLDGRDPHLRQLMVDAAVHWLREYQVDGLRLDLAEVLDDRVLPLCAMPVATSTAAAC
jgi:pullulanase/glycogen debranching enzyme